MNMCVFDVSMLMFLLCLLPGLGGTGVQIKYGICMFSCMYIILCFWENLV